MTSTDPHLLNRARGIPLSADGGEYANQALVRLLVCLQPECNPVGGAPAAQLFFAHRENEHEHEHGNEHREKAMTRGVCVWFFYLWRFIARSSTSVLCAAESARELSIAKFRHIKWSTSLEQCSVSCGDWWQSIVPTRSNGCQGIVASVTLRKTRPNWCDSIRFKTQNAGHGCVSVSAEPTCQSGCNHEPSWMPRSASFRKLSYTSPNSLPSGI
eukprot:1175950-Prorocentrum_minimum.AAC.2